MRFEKKLMPGSLRGATYPSLGSGNDAYPLDRRHRWDLHGYLRILAPRPKLAILFNGFRVFPVWVAGVASEFAESGLLFV